MECATTEVLSCLMVLVRYKYLKIQDLDNFSEYKKKNLQQRGQTHTKSSCHISRGKTKKKTLKWFIATCAECLPLVTGNNGLKFFPCALYSKKMFL
jgi:hypothetical protein